MADAGAVWCTDWDAPDVADVDAMFLDGYTAPVEIHSQSLESEYEGASERLDIRGCTPDL